METRATTIRRPLLLLLSLSFAGCTTAAPASPSPTPAATSAPAATPTPSPPPTPAATSAPAATPEPDVLDGWLRFESARFAYAIDLPDRGWEHRPEEHSDAWTGTYLEQAWRGTTLDLTLAMVFLQIGQEPSDFANDPTVCRASLEVGFVERFGTEPESRPSVRTPAGEAWIYRAHLDTGQYGPFEVQFAGVVNECGAYWILLETAREGEGLSEADVELFELLIGSFRVSCQ